MNGYLVKIIPPRGYRVIRLQFTRAHLVVAAVLTIAACAAVATVYALAFMQAQSRAVALKSLEAEQHARLRSLGAQTVQLRGEVRALQRQDAEIERLVGLKPRGRAGAQPAKHARTTVYRSGDDLASVAARIESVRATARTVGMQNDDLRRLVDRVLNLRRLRELARTRILAAIPSLNPAGAGVAIRSPFGWRSDPGPEFHQGVDLAADYGDGVSATAAGTVAFAGYDGGFGIKIDIDHGNGYHTWYAHLARADVAVGQRIGKGQHIGLVGSTGDATGPHLHYQVMLDGRPIDPAPYLNGVPANVLANVP